MGRVFRGREPGAWGKQAGPRAGSGYPSGSKRWQGVTT